MTTALRGRYRLNPGTKETVMSDFTGGLNIRDTATQVAANESPDCMNITINPRGGIEKRTGFEKWNTTGQPAALIKASYFSEFLQKTLWQASTKLYVQTTNGTFGTEIKTFTTAGRVAMVDFSGKVYVLHPVDGLFTYDGSSFSGAVSGAMAGDTIAAWQNKVWLGGNDTNKSRLQYSDPGATSFTGPGSGTVDLREVNDAKVRALHVAPRGVLLAMKEEATYRVYDSSTGAFQTLDTDIGAPNHQAVASLFGKTYSIGSQGIYSTDGTSKQFSISERVRPIFTPGFLNYAQTGLWCAGTRADKLYFSTTLAGSTANDFALEFHPLQGWIVPHTCAASTYAMFSADDEKLLAGAPAVNGQAYELYSDSGSDDGTAIASRYQTAWFKPTAFGKNTYRRLFVRGRGLINVTSKIDQEQGGQHLQQLDMTELSNVGVYDANDWDDGSVYGPAGSHEREGNLYSLGRGRDISFLIEETGSTAGGSPELLGLGNASPIGYWAVYAMHLYYIPAGLA